MFGGISFYCLDFLFFSFSLRRDEFCLKLVVRRRSPWFVVKGGEVTFLSFLLTGCFLFLGNKKQGVYLLSHLSFSPCSCLSFRFSEGRGRRRRRFFSCLFEQEREKREGCYIYSFLSRSGFSFFFRGFGREKESKIFISFSFPFVVEQRGGKGKF